MDTNEEKIVSLVSKLNKSFKTGKTLSFEWRHAQLLALQRLVKENAGDIQAAINTDLDSY
jgi:acyl-CoA reductase-like NAD-dependent aldehyde dehydrogenase